MATECPECHAPEDYETKVNVGDKWVRKDGVSDETAEFGPPAGTPIEITESVNDGLCFGFAWDGYEGPATMGRFHLLRHYRRIEDASYALPE